MFQAGGLDFDSAIENRGKNDYFPAYNIRPTGVQGLDEGYIANIESNEYISASAAPGISRCIGSAGFESARIGLEFYYNSASYNQIREINYDTNEITIIPLNWPLNPSYYVNDIKLINNEFLCFNDNYNPPAYVNYNRLKAGTATDLNLIKRQPSIIPTAVFNNDPTRSINLLNNKWFQFREQYIGLDYEQSVDSSISQLFIPGSSPTPQGTQDVTLNNNLWISVDAGDASTLQVVVDARYGGADQLWFTIKQKNRADILLLPPSIDLFQQIYEAYNPVTNQYTFVFYNDGLYVNKPVLETDQLYDAVPLKVGAMEVLNGNQLILGDITIGYPQPVVPVSLNVTNYNPNLTLPSNPTSTPISITVINPGQSGSGEGNHQRLVVIEFGGIVEQNDQVTIVLVDIRNSSSVLQYNFTASLSESGNTYAFIQDNQPSIPNSSIYNPSDGNIIGLNIVTPPYFTLQSAYVTLYNAGAGVFKSIHALKLNSAYQPALALYDGYGRPFPLQLLPVQKTNSYAQTHGQTPQINVALTGAPPAGAATYQIVLSKNNSHENTLYMLVSVLAYQSTWNAMTNTPTLSSGASTSTIGFVYQVNVAGSQDLGNGTIAYNSGDYVVYNGIGWTVLPASFGNLATSTDYYFYFNSLQQFNAKNNTSVLTYDYSDGDRCTIHFSQTPGLGQPITWYDGVANPIYDLQVQSYDSGTYLLKVDGSSSLSPSTLAGLDILIEVYTPAKQPTTSEQTVFYEIGQVYTIVNGAYSNPNVVITQGDVYFKTRQLGGSIDPNVLYTIPVEDFNYSDYFPSEFTSYGRPRALNDVLPTTEQVANMIYSQTYVIGSQVNGLTRFYAANVYGNGGGQTSSNYGKIVSLNQINNELLIIQELDHGTAPVYTNVIEDNVEQQNIAISDQILGNMRYTNGKHIGIGQGRRSVAVYNNVVYWVDSNRNEPIRWSGNGALPISGKMSKYFKQALQIAYAAGLQPIGWYDIFNDEYVVSVPQPGGLVQAFAFAQGTWQYLQQFSVLPGEITIVSTPLHSSPSYNNLTGIVVITPSTNYVGSDSFKIAFPESPSTVNICYNWIAGSGSVNPFAFGTITGAPLNTLETSNAISVIGNNYPVAISISGGGGQYSVNGGAYTSAPGLVNNGDIVTVQVTSSGSFSTLVSTVLTIDSQSATFNVYTRVAGNFTVSAQYGMSIESVTGTGVPVGLNTINVTPGNSLSAAYTTVSAGTIHVTVSGMPAIPGHVKLSLDVAGVEVASIPVSGNGTYGLALGSPQSDPTAILIAVNTY